MSDPTPMGPNLVANRPRTVPLEDVARDYGLTVAAVKRCIDEDEDEFVDGPKRGPKRIAASPRPEGLRRIPGGRRYGASYFVLRQHYETYTAVDSPRPIYRRQTG